MRSNHVVLWVTVLVGLLCGHALVQGQEVPGKSMSLSAAPKGITLFVSRHCWLPPDGTLLAICEGRKTSMPITVMSTWC